MKWLSLLVVAIVAIVGLSHVPTETEAGVYRSRVRGSCSSMSSRESVRGRAQASCSKGISRSRSRSSCSGGF